MSRARGWCAAMIAALAALLLPAISTAASLPEGPYVSLMGSYSATQRSDSGLDDGYGGVLAGGYRRDFYAIEGAAVLSTVAAGGTDAELRGGYISGLLFPLQQLPGLYLSAGVGALEMEGYPGHPDGAFSTTTVQAALGHLWTFRLGRYAFGLRTEAGYREAKREKRINTARRDIDVPTSFSDVLVHIGLHLPLSLSPASSQSPAEPVRVVPVEQRDAATPGNEACVSGLQDGVATDQSCDAAPPVAEENVPEPQQEQSPLNDDGLDFLLQSDL